MNKEDKAWYQGYTCAAAIAAKLSVPPDGRQILFEAGITKKDLEKAESDQDDIEALFKGE